MDLDRLSLDEIRQMSKLIGLLGTPAAPDELESKIRICEAAATMYRNALIVANELSRAHGE
jgi:hypothetical protein